MHTQQLAWLGCAVKGSDGKPTQTTRAQQIRCDGGAIRLPSVERVQHLVSYLQQSGTYMHGAMGLVPLTATELLAWCTGTCKRLAAWEFAALLAASRAYVTQMYADAAKPPFGSLADLSDPQTLSQRMARSLGGLARPIKRKNKA